MKIKYSWSQLKQRGETPISRSSHKISCVNGKLYCFGGEHVARTPIDASISAYDNGEWKVLNTVGSTPPERVGHAQAVVGESLYIFGGRQGIMMNEKPLNDLWQFNTSTKEWRELPSGPCPRSFHAMVSSLNQLIVFGGCGNAGRLNDIHSFDVSTETWKALPTSQATSGRGGPALGTFKNHVLVSTGFSGSENNDIFQLNTTTAQWIQPTPSYFRPRSVTGYFTLSNLLFIFGGEVSASEKGHEGAGVFENDLVCINVETGSVIECENVGSETPTARGWTSMDAFDEHSGLLFGGLAGNDESPVRLDDLWKVTIEQHA